MKNQIIASVLFLQAVLAGFAAAEGEGTYFPVRNLLPLPETHEDVTFTADCDGSRQKYVILYPRPFSASENVSVLITLHGLGSDRWQFVRNPRAECKAARDVAAAHCLLLVSPDCRAPSSWMGPKAEADLVQIIGLLRKRFAVERVILSGGSMGGTGALIFTVRHPEMVDGVISFNGTANLVEHPNHENALIASYGGAKTEVPDEYRSRSAEFFPERFTMPLATVTSGADKSVPPDSILRLVAAVRKTNPHVLSLHRPDLGHIASYEDIKAALEFVLTALPVKR